MWIVPAFDVADEGESRLRVPGEAMRCETLALKRTELELHPIQKSRLDWCVGLRVAVRRRPALRLAAIPDLIIPSGVGCVAWIKIHHIKSLAKETRRLASRRAETAHDAIQRTRDRGAEHRQRVRKVVPDVSKQHHLWGVHVPPCRHAYTPSCRLSLARSFIAPLSTAAAKLCSPSLVSSLTEGTPPSSRPKAWRRCFMTPTAFSSRVPPNVG